jgi:phosphate transport system protein
MPRDNFEAQLDDLKRSVASMGDLVTERLEDAARAYEGKDVSLGKRIAENDDEINALYLELERDCIDLLALQHPVASDLRLVAATFKILTDLERIADLAGNLGRYVQSLGREKLTSVPVADIADMAIAQVETALEAYVEEDPELCRTVAADDTDIDQRCEAAADDLVRFLVDYDATPDEL